MWKDFPRDLCRICQCPGFVFSRSGYGKSAPCALPRKINFMHKEALDILPEILATAGIKDHIIIGHSDGGSIGVIYAGSPHTARLKGLITEAAHVFVEPVTIKSIQKARKAYLEGNLKKKLERHHGENTDTAFWGWNDVWLHPKFIHWNIEKYLQRIQVPVLALQGRQDPYGSLAQLNALSDKIPDCSTRIIEECGHAPHIEQKKSILKIMGDFIHLYLPS
nr:alpha/beta hydrolase [Desulfospira joergensenii]